MNMYIDTPVQDWGKIMNETDFPDMRTTFCAFVTLALTLSFEEPVVDAIVNIFIEVFS